MAQIPVVDDFVDSNGTNIENHVPNGNPTERWEILGTSGDNTIQNGKLNTVTSDVNGIRIDNHTDEQRVTVKGSLDLRSSTKNLTGDITNNIPLRGTASIISGAFCDTGQLSISRSYSGIAIDDNNSPTYTVEIGLNNGQVRLQMTFQAPSLSNEDPDINDNLTISDCTVVGTDCVYDYDYEIRLHKLYCVVSFITSERFVSTVVDKHTYDLTKLNGITGTGCSRTFTFGKVNPGPFERVLSFELTLWRTAENEITVVILFNSQAFVQTYTLTPTEISNIDNEADKTYFKIKQIINPHVNIQNLIERIEANGFWNTGLFNGQEEIVATV